MNPWALALCWAGVVTNVVCGMLILAYWGDKWLAALGVVNLATAGFMVLAIAVATST